MLRSCTARFNLVRVPDKEVLLARFVQLGDQLPPPEYWGTVQGFIGDPSLL
jgi:hypothetical protein